MMLCWVFVMLLFSKGYSHMGITLKIGANTIYPREKATKYDAYRYPNGGVCDGTQPAAIQTTLAVGSTINAVTSNGAGHGGGHCAWFVSTDQVTWYKINDKVDCTPTSQPTAAGAGTHPFTVPSTLPAACGTKCVLGWFWCPRFSGACEIYHDCFDIKVTGTLTGISSAVSITTPINTCQRVNSLGLTPMFGTVVGGAPAGTPSTSAPGAAPTPPSTGCTIYTVKSGDTLTKIATAHSKTVQEIQTVNPAITDPNKIQLNQKITIPPCGGGADKCKMYTVKAGDYLSKIAATHGISVKQITELNPKILDPNKINIGDIVNVPPCSGVTKPPTQAGVTGKSCTCAEQKSWCQKTACKFQVQINQCWGSPPFVYCMCKDGSKPRHTGSSPCSKICQGSNCRDATDVCTLPSTCVKSTQTAATCTDGVKNGAETGIDCGGSCKACQDFQWNMQVWSSCSKTCGPGTQTRAVKCVDKSGSTVANSKCGTSTPATSQSCNLQSCGTYYWDYSNFGSCNVDCGCGLKFKTAVCRNSLSIQTSVSATLCPKIGSLNSTCCNTKTCGTHYWKFGPWQYCDAKCKTGQTVVTGKQLREVFCYAKANKKAVVDTACANAGTKPDVTKACQHKCQSSYSWKECPYSSCSTTCRGSDAGFQDRQVFCVEGGEKWVDSSKCDQSIKPPSFMQGCSMKQQPCSGSYWVLSPWGPCQNGNRARISGVKCIKNDGSVGTDSDCTGPKPSLTETCKGLGKCQYSVIPAPSPSGAAVIKISTSVFLSIFIIVVSLV